MPAAQSWWAARGRQEQGRAQERGLGRPFCRRVLPPPLPRRAPCTPLTSPRTGVKTSWFSMFKLPILSVTDRNAKANRLPCRKTQIFQFYLILWQLFADTLTRFTVKCQRWDAAGGWLAARHQNLRCR